MSDTALDRKTRRIIELPGPTAGLESGLARGVYDDSGRVQGRYRCEACHQDLILRAVKPTAKQQPHFRHQNTQECPAAPERRRQIDQDLKVVIDLRDQIIRAWPGVTVTIEQPDGDDTDAPGGTSAPTSWMPPAIVACGPGETVVIERPRTLPGPEQIQQRTRAVRARYGQGANHVWFLAKDPMQFAKCGRLEVKPRGGEKDHHLTIAPTEQQLAVIAAGGGVYFLDGQQVLIPYGVHDFTHQACQETCHASGDSEDWNFTDWRRTKNWRRDWRISHPIPDPAATRWGLVATSLNLIGATKATFDLSESRDLMQRLADVQKARWRRRHADARELYAARHAPPPPAVPLPGPTQPPTRPTNAAAPEPVADNDHAVGHLPEPKPPKQPSTEPEAVVPPPASPSPDNVATAAASESRPTPPTPPQATAAPQPLAPRGLKPEPPARPPAGPVVPPPPQYPPRVPTAQTPPVTAPRQGGLRSVLRRIFGNR
ncbi:hypothetical protein ACH4UM_37720 [Streptomyces sp. NPDC020801]|uniref:hypothetical protein n=1 Tax=Streptomyces sp. NPDC020801 TaxID=3365093 RepID=UPI0037877775